MQTKIKKAELLAVLNKNLSEHREVFMEALDNYRKKLIAELESMIEKARSGARISHHISLVQPVDQTKEYQRAIRMVEMTTDEIVSLTEQEFANFVMDDWAWSNNFFATNASYSSKARTKLSERQTDDTW